MKRRTFLGILGGTAAAFALDPELALWVPGQRTFFLPPDRAVVTATESDIEALMAAVGGPFMVQTGTQRVVLSPGGWFVVQPPMFGVPSSPEQIIKALSNEEYRLMVARGRRMRYRDPASAPVGADGRPIDPRRAERLRAQGWTL